MAPTRRHVIGLAAVLAGSLLVASCDSAESSVSEEKPIVVEETSDSEIWRLSLSESAARRLDIQTTTVELDGEGYVVPSAAVIIDPTGAYWVYTSPEPLVFVRHEIRPVWEEGGQAFFDHGPPEGTSVVITGVPELYGAEFGIGK